MGSMGGQIRRTLSYRGRVTFILGVDLDGVCGDYTEALRRVVAADRGLDPRDLPEPRSWDFAEWDLDRPAFERIHRQAVLHHRIFRTMPVIDGAAEALWRLSDAGIWIRVITHRLAVNWGHAVAVSDTVEWLDDHGIPYRDLCFLGAKPQVEAHLYVDDAPHNVAALREQGNEVVVFDAPYNRDVAAPRAADWLEVEHHVASAAARAGYTIQTQLEGLVEPASRLDAKRSRSEAPGGA
jgi:5'-nucleotidase